MASSTELPTVELLYHPSIPGKGEYIRLALEAASIPYTDPARSGDPSKVYSVLGKGYDSSSNPPLFAPPALRVPGTKNTTLLISQTANILLYIAENLDPHHTLLPANDPTAKYHVNHLTLTALDLTIEAHNVHHPVAVMMYYEEQKEEALRAAVEFRKGRITKYLGYFERVLEGVERGEGGEKEERGRHLYGSRLTYADLALWQTVEGILHAFPSEMKATADKYPLLLGTFHPGIKAEPKLQEYFKSGRRPEFSNGLFRYYPELDRQQE